MEPILVAQRSTFFWQIYQQIPMSEAHRGQPHPPSPPPSLQSPPYVPAQIPSSRLLMGDVGSQQLICSPHSWIEFARGRWLAMAVVLYPRSEGGSGTEGWNSRPHRGAPVGCYSNAPGKRLSRGHGLSLFALPLLWPTHPSNRRGETRFDILHINQSNADDSKRIRSRSRR